MNRIDEDFHSLLDELKIFNQTYTITPPFDFAMTPSNLEPNNRFNVRLDLNSYDVIKRWWDTTSVFLSVGLLKTKIKVINFTGEENNFDHSFDIKKWTFLYKETYTPMTER